MEYSETLYSIIIEYNSCSYVFNLSNVKINTKEGGEAAII